MHRDATAVLQPELGSGEKLLWSGRPQQGLRLRASDALLIPFSLMWGGFAIFWEYSALQTGPLFFALWGIPFVGVGLYLIAGRFFVDAWQRARTHYGLTNQRVLIVAGLRSRQVTSLPLRTLADVSLQERSDRSGTIQFGHVPAPYGWMARSGWPGPGRHLPPAFELIENVRSVYTQLQQAQQTQIAPAAVSFLLAADKAV